MSCWTNLTVKSYASSKSSYLCFNPFKLIVKVSKRSRHNNDFKNIDFQYKLQKDFKPSKNQSSFISQLQTSKYQNYITSHPIIQKTINSLHIQKIMNSTGNSKTSGNILKDSYYKQRLLRSNAANMFKTGNPTSSKFYMQQNRAMQNEQSDNDQIPQEEQELNLQRVLQRFGKTSAGETYAFLDFICTHKKLKSLKILQNYQHLQKVDLSYNNLTTLKYLSGLKYLTSVIAINNQLTSVLDMKYLPLSLDYVDLSHNQISRIPTLQGHKYLRVLKLVGNKITTISGLQKSKKLQILNLSQNLIQQIKGLDGVDLKELYLGSNKIENIKNLQKLINLRVLQLDNNKISKLSGLLNLVGLRELSLAKNSIKKVKEIQYLQNLMYLTSLDLSYNPLQERQYYRIQVIYKLPMLQKLDGVTLTGKQITTAESFYGLDYEERQAIFVKKLPEEEFVDRRVFKAEMIANETDSEGEGNRFVDEYDEEGRMTRSNRSKDSKGFSASKRSNFSKNSKASKLSKGKDRVRQAS